MRRQIVNAQRFANRAGLRYKPQIGKIFFIGLKPDGRIWVFNRNIGRCTGIAVAGSELWVAGGSEILRFNNPQAGGTPIKDEPDALYVLRAFPFHRGHRDGALWRRGSSRYSPADNGRFGQRGPKTHDLDRMRQAAEALFSVDPKEWSPRCAREGNTRQFW